MVLQGCDALIILTSEIWQDYGIWQDYADVLMPMALTPSRRGSLEAVLIAAERLAS